MDRKQKGSIEEVAVACVEEHPFNLLQETDARRNYVLLFLKHASYYGTLRKNEKKME